MKAFHLSKKSAGIKNEYVGLISHKVIILIRNFTQIFKKNNSDLLSEIIAIDLKQNLVIEHLMFVRHITEKKTEIYDEIDGKMVVTGIKSEIDKIIEAMTANLQTIYENGNHISFINYKSIRGENIKFSKFDQAKWLGKTEAYFGVPEKGTDKS